MPTATYIALANLTLTGTDSSIIFNSIPNTYRHLVVITNTDNTAQADYYIRFNGDTGNNYNRVTAQATGSVVSYNSSTNAAFMRLNGNGDLATDFSHNAIIEIFDYAVTDKQKIVISRTNSTFGVDMTGGRWASTNPITSITIYPSTGSFEIGSTFALYGIVS
jgi:phosphate-selective porin